MTQSSSWTTVSRSSTFEKKLTSNSLVSLARTFAPYTDILNWPTLDVSQVAQQTGVAHFTLAFITTGQGNVPAWGGAIPLDKNFYMDQIINLRKLGGDAIVSFGGANGELS
jgi:chitinase